MSFSSSVSSALVKPDPSTLLRGAVGSRIVPTINTTAVGSGLFQPFASFVVPKGVWMLSGDLTLITATVGQSLAGNVGISLDAVVACRYTIANNVLNQVSIPISYCFVSDGTVDLTMPCNFNTTTGNYSATTATNQTTIVLTCIA